MKAYANDETIKKVVVIGGGYIGIELVEAFNRSKKEVTLIDLVTRPVPRYFDVEFTDKLVEDMKAHGVKTAFGERFLKFEGKNGKVSKVITDKNSYDADLVIMAIGFAPNTSLLPNAKKIQNGALIVDEYMRTSITDIYAIGDCVAIPYAPTGQPANIALATNAVRTGLVAAHHIANPKSDLKLPSIVGTNGIYVFDNRLAATGMSEEAAKLAGMDVLSSTFEDNDRPEFMNDEGLERVKCKMVYDAKTRKLLGAQIGSYGKTNHSEAIFYLALAIDKGMTIEQVAIVDLYFLPHYNKPLNYLLQTALNAPRQ
ncbi:unnamed protein product [Didymodactylos carnosus]|uniref:NADH oxidase n=1 Tax=Didymodactylos carnosus TaxID=1234261 RepID=A0A8S2GDX0_9BILA|nr:unnamed protein product [Didymodactylos carnosus]CAF3491707.1 unnamed protein product [Didymodactylos carnosus]